MGIIKFRSHIREWMYRIFLQDYDEILSLKADYEQYAHLQKAFSEILSDYDIDIKDLSSILSHLNDTEQHIFKLLVEGHNTYDITGHLKMNYDDFNRCKQNIGDELKRFIKKHQK